MSPCSRLATGEVLLCLGAASLVPAQQAHLAATAGSVCERAELRPGIIVRVHSRPHTIIGPVIECSPESLRLGPDMGREDSLVTIPARTVEYLWIRGDNKMLGFYMGLGVGALAGYAWNAAPASLCNQKTNSYGGNSAGTCSGNRFVGAAIGAGVGAVLGYVIGAAMPRWVRKIP